MVVGFNRVKQPMLVYEFLRAFNQKLDPAASKNISAAKKVAAASKAILLGRQNGLHRVTTLGLKYCHISKKSVGLLEVSPHTEKHFPMHRVAPSGVNISVYYLAMC